MSRLYNVLDALADKSQFVVETKAVNIGTIAQGGVATGTASIAKSGYTPLGIMGWGNTGSSGFYLYSLMMSGTTLTASARNISTGSISNAGVSVSILYRLLTVHYPPMHPYTLR